MTTIIKEITNLRALIAEGDDDINAGRFTQYDNAKDLIDSIISEKQDHLCL